MSTVPTVKVKADTERGYRVINAGDFDSSKHQPYDDEAKQLLDVRANLSDAERKLMEERDAQKRVDGNYGQTGGSVVDSSLGAKNPSGTFSEPTPTDVRYPDKLATEFENNLGAFVGQSAAGIRAELGMEDAPGGVKPSVREAVETTADEAARVERTRAKEARQVTGQPIAEQAETAPESQQGDPGDESTEAKPSRRRRSVE